jgi:hypothetical protein
VLRPQGIGVITPAAFIDQRLRMQGRVPLPHAPETDRARWARRFAAMLIGPMISAFLFASALPVWLLFFVFNDSGDASVDASARWWGDVGMKMLYLIAVVVGAIAFVLTGRTKQE